MSGNSTPRSRSRTSRTQRRNRLAIAAANNEPCIRCHQPINYKLPYRNPDTGRINRGYPTADHLDPLAHGHPELTTPDRLAPAHYSCNSRHGTAIGKARKKKAQTNTAFIPPQNANPHGGRQNPSPISDNGGGDGPEHGPVPADFVNVPWLADLFPLPAEAVWPRLMSAPHPDAVGSYGGQAIAWIEARRGADRRIPARAKQLRWFQRLVLLRQWEHDAEGRLCWPETLLTVSRQCGKSVLLSERSMCRVQLFPELAGEPQLVMQISKDLSAAREVQRLIRLWAEDEEAAAKDAVRSESGKLPPGYRPSFVVRGTHGQEEIELPDGSRYMIRGRDSVYSYSVSAGEVDEAWGVRPEVVDDGIEPTMAEREFPQLCLTSTAHPRATALFPSRRALAVADLWRPAAGSGLLVEWSAHPSWGLGDEGVWRAASPHWDERRRGVVARAYRRWAEGDEGDEARHEGGFPFQYGNRWLTGVGAARLFSAGAWAEAGVSGLVVGRDRAVVGLSLAPDGLWPVVMAAAGSDGVVGVRVVGVFGSLEEAAAGAAGAAGRACVLVVPRHALRGQVQVSGVRSTLHATEEDAVSALTLAPVTARAGVLRHDPADSVLRAAVLGVPAKRVARVWDAGTLALVCAWWASKPRQTATVV